MKTQSILCDATDDATGIVIGELNVTLTGEYEQAKLAAKLRELADEVDRVGFSNAYRDQVGSTS